MGIDQIPTKWLREIINLSIEQLVIVNREGMILYINSGYCEFLGTTVEQAIGKHVTDVIENSRMHIVAKTGQAELDSVQSIKGSEMIANRYPLKVDGELVGAFGNVMFRTPEDWLNYKQKIQPLLDELKYYQTKFEKDLRSKYSFRDLIGKSSTFQNAKLLAERISGSQSAVLLLGESGTGKELFAHAIHDSSTRASFPFVPINCASIPEHLLESELFGYEDGSFTGAKKGGKKGQFQIANYGTIFLDEVGDMPLSMQSKLLRVLQEKEILQVGGQKSIPVDVRVIAATHRDLEKMVEEGKFRKDLYYRLNVIKIEIPPLRKRREDIRFIADNLLKKLEKKFYRQGLKLSEQVIERFHQHLWPGNIRELENVLERAINVLDGDSIEVADLPLYLRDQEIDHDIFIESLSRRDTMNNVTNLPIQPLRKTIEYAEKQAILHALAVANGNKQEAAKLLHIGKTRFYEKCKIYEIK
ncbi:MAG TPA: sigma 54-interacting transcriptional regulator [Pseudoneobacillus sp.]|nr:sigma 54-interacting transcriptional regulator [Pseudoneobacillus sp.]